MNLQTFIRFGNHWYNQHKRRRGIVDADITAFLRQFATLINAGIPLIKACAILEKSQEKTALRLLIYSIKRDISAGRQLAHTMRQYPVYFNELLCQLIHLGEQTGKLDAMLGLIADAQEKKLILKKRIKQTLFYPSVILITAILLMLSMLLFVIPRFAELFQDTQDKLPLLTVWIFYLSAQLRKCSWLIGMSFICLILFARQIKKTKLISILQNYLFNRLPILSQYLHKVILAHFTRNMSIAFAAGIPILDALQLASHGSHPTFHHAMTILKSRVSAGESMHRAMSRHAYFSSFMVQMIKIGEESGMLDSMLAKTADFLEADIEQQTLRLGQTLEPLIMIVLGVLIGGLVVSMYLPIFKLGSTL